MKSVLATRQRRELVESVRRLTPAQRLDAFLAHSRLMTKLLESGRESRRRTPGR